MTGPENQEMNEKAIDGSIKDANQREETRMPVQSLFMRSCNCIHIAYILFDRSKQPAACSRNAAEINVCESFVPECDCCCC